MKFCALLLLVVSLTAFAQAEDTCEIGDGKTIKVGEVYHPVGECMERKCIGKNSLGGVGCPAEHAPASCKFIPQDNSKEYPACCPKYEC